MCSICTRAIFAWALFMCAALALSCTSNIHDFLSGLGSDAPRTFDDGPVFTNPFGTSNNSYGVFFTYRGMIYVGPSPDGSYLVRFNPAGTGMETVSLTMHGASSTTSTMNPGPDGETGIDSFTSGSIDGAEYLFVGPAKSGGDLNYLYYTSDSSASMNLYYMNVGGGLTAETSGTQSLLVFNNQLYGGFAAGSGGRPRLLKITGVGSNPTTTNLSANAMPRIGSAGSPANTASIVGVDFLLAYDGALFLGNGGSGLTGHDGGLVSSQGTHAGDPRNYQGQPGDWDTTLTPAGTAAWDAGFSIELSAMNGVTPSARAFSAAVVFNGSLYLARNTTAGPQIWAYNGASFSLVADNGSYLSNMGVGANSRITLLAVNGDRLYVGYDNSSDGVMMYRTLSGMSAPSAQSDFERVSSGGLGDPASIQKIFHAVSVSDGSDDYLWVLCGTAGGNMYVFRTSN